MRELFERLWGVIDRWPLRVKTILVTAYTALAAITVLAALLAATIGPKDVGFVERVAWLFARLGSTAFVPAALALLLATTVLQVWANRRATAQHALLLERTRQGQSIEQAHVRAAMDELSVFPLKAALIAWGLWMATALCWWFLLDWVQVFANYINLFIAVGIGCEGCLVFPFQYHMFKLQIKRDYFLAYDLLDEPYFPDRARFVTIRSKLAGSITIVVLFSLIALFASNTLLAWQGVRDQTVEVGHRLLSATALGIASARREAETEAKLSQGIEGGMGDYLVGGETWSGAAGAGPSSDEMVRDHVIEHLKEVEQRIGQSYYLFNAQGTIEFGSKKDIPGNMLKEAVASLKESADAALINAESRDTQDLFLAVPIEWGGGTHWHLGTFYRAQDMQRSIKSILTVSILLILVMMSVGLVIAALIATDASASLKKMARLASEVSEGDLSRIAVRVISEDEIGILARSLTYMFSNFRQTVRSIDVSSQSVDVATSEIEGVARQVSEGSELQVNNSKDTTRHMGELSAAIKSIEENVEVLTGSAEESSSNIFEMGTTIEEVANSVSQLFDSVDESTSVVTEMVTSIRQVAESVDNLSRITGETAHAMEEMTHAIGLVEQDAAETQAISQQTAEEARGGADAVQQTVEGIYEIRTSVGTAHKVIHTLNESADAIGNILNYISDVADQTNLLSLNAGIIAAQAGEHGKGFAVIAKEVSTLAERTGRYTREIERLIADVQSNARDAIVTMEAGSEAVDRGVDLSKRSGEALKKILDSAEQASNRVATIVTTASAQTNAARRVTGAIEEVSGMAQQIARATQEQSRGSERILQSGETMRQVTALVKKTTQEQARNSKTITKAIENINDMVRYINEAQRKEVDTCARVGDLVEAINRVTLRNFDNVMHLDRAIEVLRSQSSTLKSQVSRFRLSGNGTGSGGEA